MVIIQMVWSGVYVQPHSNIDKQKGMDAFYIFTGVLAMIVYIFRYILFAVKDFIAV